MRKLIFSAVIVLSLLSFGLFQYENKVTAEESLIRFHVIANSDSDIDQEVKLKVRDAVLAKYTDDLSACANYQEAYKFLLANQENMAIIARETLTTWGFDYGAKVVIDKDTFPTKTYGDLTLAAGEYEAVKIVLGEGLGKNWWCVMFPPLCFVDISQNVGVAKLETYDYGTNSEIVAANGGVTQIKIESKLLELLQ